ncbi:potassium/sodium eff [Dothidotthia symphoricarpi CBS 119687]|uniref:P-type Na(+) transporter n=1 Tax=Dothidotthia symphoricarpi CBS 119687 TaxID=1392245 RepID=A0A6A6A0M8_9PLEO|nr:potassium/sodium eff [Dothidotthia symphoricarpi CBS 119687]KAF2125399.1 potassium/sodium eff [Dothidotthia symphoricarpi CBS 119687]
MGETVLPAVEETAPQEIEPRTGGSNGLNTTNRPGQLQPNPSDGATPSPLHAPHTLTFEEVAEELRVDINHGLSTTEAESRLQLYGPNKVKGAEGLSMWKILMRQISNSLTFVLIIVMAISFGIDDYIEGGVVTAVICLNIVVGFWQDYRAEKTIESLKKLTAPEATVTRDGTTDVKVKAVDLVPGDIVQLSVGSIVPADIRLIDGVNAFTNEAFLTGESIPVEKTPLKVFDDFDLATGDRTNLAFSGSEMTSGRCRGIVVATAMETEVGKIATMLRQKKDDAPESLSFFGRLWRRFVRGLRTILGLVGTPLQITLSKFALLLFGLAILLAIIVFSASKWQVGGEVLIYGICVAVAVIPESLIAVLTITIAVGGKAMAKANVITRVQSAIEAVGGVTNICSDKTGTLTQGRMVTRKALIQGVGTIAVDAITDPFDPRSGRVTLDDERLGLDQYQPSTTLARFLRTIALCNNSKVQTPSEMSIETSNEKSDNADRSISDDDPDTDASTIQSATLSSAPGQAAGTWKAHGEPTEIALHVLASRFGMGKEDILRSSNISLATEFSFDSTVKKMTVVYKDNHSGNMDVYTKGATEFMLPVLNVSEQKRDEIMQAAESMANEGLRVLCVAHKALSPGTNIQERASVEDDLDYIGLVAIYDPPRLGTKGAVRECKVAGITVHMLTGDHPGTARAIAKDVDIIDDDTPASAVMIARDFDQMTDEQIDNMETLPLVIARCSPKTKVKMVQALHRRQRFCVMTGDGVNDSPALKQANVGMAMGTGSDVAKDAAEMVLTDDNFASIVKAVEEGRRLFDNIQKFLMHLLISNIAQVILLLIGLAFKDNDNHSVFPLSPIEILWVNLITSSFLAIGLGLEESQTDSMLRPPRDVKAGVFSKELITDKFIYGFFMGALCLFSFAIVAYVGPGGGNLGSGCNEAFNDTCDVVFRARATTYCTITLLLLVTAWEVKHFARSLFNMYPHTDMGVPRGLSVFPTLWRNRFLFFAVIAGLVTMFPIVYIPVINEKVFKHGTITWEWGVSFGCVVIYISAIETWKMIKRRCGIWSGAHKVVSREDAEARAGLDVGGVREKKR